MCLGFTFHRRINRPVGEPWFSAIWEGAQFLLPSSARCHFVVAGSMLPKPISFLKNFLRPASSHCSAALESGGLKLDLVVLKLDLASASPGHLVQPQTGGPSPSLHFSTSGEEPEDFLSYKSPGKADDAGPQTTLREPLAEQITSTGLEARSIEIGLYCLLSLCDFWQVTQFL